jgi:hypothetical protein
MFADLLLISQNRPAFTWGGIDLKGQAEVRVRYIAGLPKADSGDLGSLRSFVRS